MLLALSAGLLVVLIYFIVDRLEILHPVPSPESSPLGQTDAGMSQLTFFQSKAGAIQWRVDAQRGRLLELEHKAELEDVRVTLFKADGWQLRLQGDTGTIDTATKNFMLAKRDGVIQIDLADGYTMLTNHLRWDDSLRVMTTDDRVIIRGEGLELTGEGFVGRLEEEEFQFLNNVEVQFGP